ncbi:MAG: sigma-54-dependent Fis family transcriptional regulator [Candidatus Abyssobacteria bacterium SURF_17]|uniref:Sigma-54-dependent Fis family transcriptional regulator n=1 Tax=Candidatus Abyssobacteria bacterium SURF_17 TaxID=2093361 RepID=A0A419ETZ6_9BACT|nr:MAG: sigma-54-dependent Fis family transcriptional regulator [Candidatus Abyssubacteria bacterium SURF_17]
MKHILIVSKDTVLKEQLTRVIDPTKTQLDMAESLSSAMSLSTEMQYDAALVVVNRYDSRAAEFLTEFLDQNPQTMLMPVSPNVAVEHVLDAMRRGAADFIHQPVTAEEIVTRISKCIESRRMKREIDFLRHTQPHIYRFDDIVGVSAPMKKVFSLLRKVAPTDATVLIMGETGTGKELIAGAIHFNSPRAKNSFVKVNCAALPENLLESELFGHEKGAFTGAHRQRVGRFEQADAGTIFLDEIGDMGASTQAKILRVLQEHQFERLGGTQTIDVDVRVIAATNKDLTTLMNSGQFREDLFYRLNVVTIELAPLRERREDIGPLVTFFLKKYAAQINNRVESVSTPGMKMLEEYHWPGNIRQLQNVIERAVIMCEGTKVLPEHIALYDKASPKKKEIVEIPEDGVKLVDVERQLIVQALERTGWVQKNAAKLLGMSPRVINYKIRKHRIKRPDL